MMLKIKWSDRFCVNLPEIDEQQKQIIEKINDIVDAVNSSTDQKEIYDMISELTDFVRHRFSQEEKSMVECNFPDHLHHRKDHREFIRKIIMFRKMFADESATVKDDFIKLIEEWLVHHCEAWDGNYAPYVRLHRYVEECNVGKKRSSR